MRVSIFFRRFGPLVFWHIHRYEASSPQGRRAGTFLADGWCGALVNLIGDLDYLSGTLGQPRWSRASNSCALCLCDKDGPFTWRNFQENAGWINRVWTPQAWRNWEGRSRCRLFEIHGLTACNVSCDWLHAKYLGSDLVAFGSILWLWAFVLGPGNETENMKIFDTFLKEFYREHRTSSRFTSFLSTRMFCNKKGIKLKGKGAQVKALGLPLLQFWQQKHNPNVALQCQILVYLKLNVQLETTLDNHKDDLFLGPSAAIWDCGAQKYYITACILFQD